MKPGKTSSFRLEYLDWVRGVGALIMLQGHVFHSFLRPELRDGSAYRLSQFVGGMPPAIFLFLTGVTFGFLMDSTARKGFSPRERVWMAARRSGYLFAVAILFRLQLWLFSWPVGQVRDLLRVDILNAMGFAILTLAPLALCRTRLRIRVAAALGLGIALAAPVVTQLPWHGVPWLVRAYVAPDYNFFSFFPWAAFVAFGVSAGSVIRLTHADAIARVMGFAAAVGGVLALGSLYLAYLPYSIYPHAEYWLDSPLQILTKLGVVLLMLAVAFAWTRYGAGGGWSGVRQLGTTSLLVYWVHVELVYGRWLWFFKERLTVAEAVAVSAALVLAMSALSWLRTNWGKVTAALSVPEWGPEPDRVSGD